MPTPINDVPINYGNPASTSIISQVNVARQTVTSGYTEVGKFKIVQILSNVEESIMNYRTAEKYSNTLRTIFDTVQIIKSIEINNNNGNAQIITNAIPTSTPFITPLSIVNRFLTIADPCGNNNLVDTLLNSNDVGNLVGIIKNINSHLIDNLINNNFKKHRKVNIPLMSPYGLTTTNTILHSWMVNNRINEFALTNNNSFIINAGPLIIDTFAAMFAYHRMNAYYETSISNDIFSFNYFDNKLGVDYYNNGTSSVSYIKENDYDPNWYLNFGEITQNYNIFYILNKFS